MGVRGEGCVREEHQSVWGGRGRKHSPSRERPMSMSSTEAAAAGPPAIIEHGTDLDLVARSSALAQSLRESSLHDAFQWLRPWPPLSEYLPFVLPPNVSSLLDQNISTPLKTNTFGHHRHTGTGLVFYAQGARRSIGTCHPSTTCLLLPL